MIYRDRVLDIQLRAMNGLVGKSLYPVYPGQRDFGRYGLIELETKCVRSSFNHWIAIEHFLYQGPGAALVAKKVERISDNPVANKRDCGIRALLRDGSEPSGQFERRSK